MRKNELPDGPGRDTAAALVERLRDVHARMVDAVLSGDRMRDVAMIAAEAVGAPVAVVIPALGHELVEPASAESEHVLAALRGYIDSRLGGVPAVAPGIVTREALVSSGDLELGAIMMLSGDGQLEEEEAQAILHMASMAAMTDSALVESKQQVEDELRGSFFEELRDGAALPAPEVVRRAARMGCDVSRGATVLAGDPPAERSHRFMAAIKTDCPSAFVQRLHGRIYAVIPAEDGQDAQDRAMAYAAALARRLQAHAPVGLSSFCPNPSELGQAIREVDLIVDVLGHSDISSDGIIDGTYRLLLQLLSSHPEQLDAYFEQTVAPIARYDEQYRSELVRTLATYLEHDCKMNATADALYSHRHTVAYRLDRIRELTGLDPARFDDRERLSLGLKIHRLTRRAS
jgi:sugar diacid utilization regulator